MDVPQKMNSSQTESTASLSKNAPSTSMKVSTTEPKSKFSSTKILDIIKSAHEFGGATQDAVFLLSRATEFFLEKMAQDLKSWKPGTGKLSYDMLTDMAHKKDEYVFLAKQGILPKRITNAEAMERRQKVLDKRKVIDDPFYGLEITIPQRNQSRYAAQSAMQQDLPSMLKSLYSPPKKLTSPLTSPVARSSSSPSKQPVTRPSPATSSPSNQTKTAAAVAMAAAAAAMSQSVSNGKDSEDIMVLSGDVIDGKTNHCGTHAADTAGDDNDEDCLIIG